MVSSRNGVGRCFSRKGNDKRASCTRAPDGVPSLRFEESIRGGPGDAIDEVQHVGVGAGVEFGGETFLQRRGVEEEGV